MPWSDVSGDLAGRQIEFDAKNEEQAAGILKKVLAEFDMTKLTKVEIVGKPEIAREGTTPGSHVTIKISPDMDAWREFSRPIHTILAKVAVRRAGLTASSARSTDPGILVRQLEGRGALVALLASMVGTQQTQWELFRVPDSLGEAIRSQGSRVHCRLVCILQDEQHNDLARITAMRSGEYYDSSSLGEACGVTTTSIR